MTQLNAGIKLRIFQKRKVLATDGLLPLWRDAGGRSYLTSICNWGRRLLSSGENTLRTPWHDELSASSRSRLGEVLI